jgi:hypothetical protein
MGGIRRRILGGAIIGGILAVCGPFINVWANGRPCLDVHPSHGPNGHTAIPAAVEGSGEMTASKPEATVSEPLKAGNFARALRSTNGDKGAAVELSAVVCSTSAVGATASPLPAGWWGCLADCLDSAGVSPAEVAGCGFACGVAIVLGIGVWACAICVGVNVGFLELCGHLCLIYA